MLLAEPNKTEPRRRGTQQNPRTQQPGPTGPWTQGTPHSLRTVDKMKRHVQLATGDARAVSKLGGGKTAMQQHIMQPCSNCEADIG